MLAKEGGGKGALSGGQSESEEVLEGLRGGFLGRWVEGPTAEKGEAIGSLAEERFLGSPSFVSRAVEGSRFLSSLTCSNKFFSLLCCLVF